MVLTYENGVLSKAVTRGNGEIGEVITGNARTFVNLPMSIPYKERLILRGEAVITYSDFEKLNASIADADARYKNHRNLCSGAVRQLNSAVTASRNVRFMAFSLVPVSYTHLDVYKRQAPPLPEILLSAPERTDWKEPPSPPPSYGRNSIND